MFNNDWDFFLKEEINKPYFKEILNYIDNMNDEIIFPAKNHIFKALELTSYSDTKVVILGQDPYHGANQANGLAFAVNPGIKNPPSLRNIIKELNADLKIDVKNINLENWSKEGVLLLNSVLTVESGKAGSHQNLGWQAFTDKVIEMLNEKADPVVFILWGNYAKSKRSLINNHHHLIIESTHPSPFSANRGFLGSKPFSSANNFLGKRKIKWY